MSDFCPEFIQVYWRASPPHFHNKEKHKNDRKKQFKCSFLIL